VDVGLFYIQDNKTAETNIELKELEIEIQNILNELPAQRRLIFKLNRIDGLKYKEISETLSISVNTVQKQMTEAIKHVEKYKHHLRATLHVSTILFTFWHS
jgi:RNA polymerase sigma factor (sigma-70 family)